MRKNVLGRQFKRDVNERKALFKSLISALILQGKIKTTHEKAKAIKADVDKIITKAKQGQTARRLLRANLLEGAVKKVIDEIAPRFEKRQGGYSRIIKIGRRLSDNASMAFIELVETETKPAIKNDDKKMLPAGEADRNEAEIKIDMKDKKKETKKTKTVKKTKKEIKK